VLAATLPVAGGAVALVEALLPWGVVLIVVSAVLGGLAQGTVGFGAAFATVPALALTAPELLPGTMLVAVLPLTAAMAVLERAGIDRPATRRLLVARVPGIAIGTAIVVVADVRWLTLLVGVVLLMAVAAAGSGWQLSVTPGREWAAGAISGVTGAATALGGPPLAILYRGRDPAVTRPTLAVVWAVGIAMTLASLALVGSLTTIQVVLGAGLSAAVLGGLVAGRQVVARVSAGTIRTAVLWWAAVGGSAAILRAVAG
jgi:uncharacterized protein